MYAAHEFQLGLGGEQVRGSPQQWHETLHAAAGVELAGVESDVDVRGEPPQQLELRLQRLLADKGCEIRHPGVRQAARQVGRAELVVGGRPDQVAPLAAFVEQHVDAARLALMGHVAGRVPAQLVAEVAPVVVLADAAQHGGSEAQAAKGVDHVRRLPPTAAMTLDRGEGLVQLRAQRLGEGLFRAAGRQLAPQGEAVRQPVDEVEVEGAAADEVQTAHQSDP